MSQTQRFREKSKQSHSKREERRHRKGNKTNARVWKVGQTLNSLLHIGCHSGHSEWTVRYKWLLSYKYLQVLCKYPYRYYACSPYGLSLGLAPLTIHSFPQEDVPEPSHLWSLGEFTKFLASRDAVSGTAHREFWFCYPLSGPLNLNRTFTTSISSIL